MQPSVTEDQIEQSPHGSMFLDQWGEVYSREYILDAIDYMDSDIAGCGFVPTSYVGESDTVHA